MHENDARNTEDQVTRKEEDNRSGEQQAVCGK